MLTIDSDRKLGVGPNRGNVYRLVVMALASWFSSTTLAVIISPVKVELSPAHPVVTITVTNDSDVAMILQNQILAWTQVDGEDQLEESNDLLVAPMIAQISPRASQVFRVTQRHQTAVITERAYRLVLDDISSTARPIDAEVVNFVFSHRLPVFIAGTSTVGPQLQLGICPAAIELGCVRLTNAGDSYAQVQKLMVTGTDWQQELGAGTRILAGSWLQWTFASPPLSVGQLTITADTTAGRAIFELPNPALLLSPIGSNAHEPH